MCINKKAFAIAQNELGTAEINGDAHNQRIIEYHATTLLKANTDEISWCSSFVNWCILKAGGTPTHSAAARSWLNWGVQIYNPVVSDLVILKRGTNPQSGHVGFYVEENETHIKLLGGNQSNKVCYAWYSKTDVIGYRRYAIEEEPEIY